MRPERTPKAYAHHINWGFSAEGQRWPSDKVLDKRSVGPSLLHLKRALKVIRSLHHKCWQSLSEFVFLFFNLWCFFFFFTLFFNNTFSLHSSGRNLFLLWLKPHLIVSVTGALSYQSPLHPQKSRGASSKLRRDGLNNSGLRSSAW